MSITHGLIRIQKTSPAASVDRHNHWWTRVSAAQKGFLRACLKPTCRRPLNPDATQAFTMLWARMLLLPQIDPVAIGPLRLGLHWPVHRIEALLEEGADPNAVDLVDLMKINPFHRAYTPDDPEGLFRILTAVIRAGHVFSPDEQSLAGQVFRIGDPSSEPEQLAAMHNAKIAAEDALALEEAITASPSQASSTPSRRRL